MDTGWQRGRIGEEPTAADLETIENEIMKIKNRITTVCAWLLTALTALTVQEFNSARAAGLLIADGGLGGVLEIKEHEVQVTINTELR
jgi:hypothetical protein